MVEDEIKLFELSKLRDRFLRTYQKAGEIMRDELFSVIVSISEDLNKIELQESGNLKKAMRIYRYQPTVIIVYNQEIQVKVTEQELKKINALIIHQYLQSRKHSAGWLLLRKFNDLMEMLKKHDKKVKH